MNLALKDFPPDWQMQLAQNGHFWVKLTLDKKIQDLVKAQNWLSLDQIFQKFCGQDGDLFKVLSLFCRINVIEFIISIRDASNPWEEDGIWHDDGSRKMAFSLSLTADVDDIEGGVLEIRKKQTTISQKISPFAFGDMLIFATGQDHFEHKINQVTKGKRVIIAGWCQ